MEYKFNNQKYGDAQTAFLELAPYLTGPLSVVGSSLIIRSIQASRNRPLSCVYHRLMLAISILDFLSSLGIVVFGAWAVPEEVEFSRFGRGTFETCEAAGVLLNLGFGTMWYSCFLSVYFLLRVRFECKEDTIARTVEPLAHLLGLGFPIITGLTGLAHDAISPLRGLPGACWFTEYPPYCHDDESPPCLRGGHVGDGFRYSFAGTLFSLLVVIITSMVLIVHKVRHTESLLRGSVDGMVREDLSLAKETAWQGVLYIGSFFAVYFPILMLFALDNNRDNYLGVTFTFAALNRVLTPLQGCFNAYIYLRKRFWNLTAEGECFFFITKIPIVGDWIVDRSRRPTSTRRSATDSSNLDNATFRMPRTTDSALPKTSDSKKASSAMESAVDDDNDDEMALGASSEDSAAFNPTRDPMEEGREEIGNEDATEELFLSQRDSVNSL